MAFIILTIILDQLLLSGILITATMERRPAMTAKSDFYIQSIASTKQGGYFEYKPMYISSIPVIENAKDSHDKIVQLIDSILKYQKQCLSVKSDNDEKIIQQKVSAVDRQIDRLVYELYELSEDEIRIVEGGE
jgi:hypothetical protein